MSEARILFGLVQVSVQSYRRAVERTSRPHPSEMLSCGLVGLHNAHANCLTDGVYRTGFDGWAAP